MPDKVLTRIAALGLSFVLGGAVVVSASELSQVSGTLHYPESISLPSDATAYITLSDVSPLQDSSAEIVSRQVLPQPHRDSVSFVLEYDPAKINERYLYAVQVRVAAGGEVLLTNSAAVPVITQGNPTTVEVHLRTVD